MATNGEIPSGDAEMAECDGEEVVTMMDVLKEQQEFEDDANAVLGGSDEKECTYSQGYIKRQAIYACMTCCPESKDDPLKRAGFCLACSLSCHENHDVVELYTKRNFRCDCGNPKFKSPCQFTPSKPELNTENVYNQNFIGLYCSCSKPYGDPETTLDDEMIQCIICEDWWHATHLDAVVPAPDQYSEMICKLCMTKNEFLHDYSDLTVYVESVDVDVVKVNGVDNKGTDKLINGSVTEEKLVNGTDEKLTNGIEESVENETSTETTNETANEGEESSGKESVNAEQVENKTDEPKKTDENKSEVPMDTEETDKTTDILTEVSPEGKTETSADQEDSSAPSEKTADSNTESEKTEDRNDPDEKNEGNEPPEKKTEESSSADNNVEDTSISVDKPKNAEEAADNAEETADNAEEAADNAEETADNAESIPTEITTEPPTENDECSAQASSETNSENVTPTESSGNINTIESNVTEKEIDQENLETESASVETDKSSAADKENDKTTDQGEATTSQDEEMNDISKDAESEAKESSENDTSKQDVDAKDESTNLIDSNNTVPELVSTDNKRKIDDVENISVKKPKLDDSKCLRPKGVKKIHNGATFWPSTFRQKLCTCNECIEMYKDLSVLFLTDTDDTVYAYETLGKERTAGKLNQYEKGMEALSSLGRIQQIDALTEYNKMRDKLLTFLKSFKDKKEIVTEHDIKTFFAGMKPEKHTDGVYFCR